MTTVLAQPVGRQVLLQNVYGPYWNDKVPHVLGQRMLVGPVPQTQVARPRSPEVGEHYGPVGPSFFTVSDRPPARPGESEIGPIVVWLWGEHDLSTDSVLWLTLAPAIDMGSAGVIIDLSAVEFMGASTLGSSPGPGRSSGSRQRR